MQKVKTILLIVIVSVSLGQVGLAHWDPDDGHKMHYPQLPDPQGWDVCLRPMAVADDFQCGATGPITEIHFWVSWKNDIVREVPAWHISIHEDADGRPGRALWRYKKGAVALKYEEPSEQGWLCQCDPIEAQKVIPNNHTKYAQVNITEIEEPFVQAEGTIYWLAIRGYMPLYEAGVIQPEVGWKTSLQHFRKPAVWMYWPMNSADNSWDAVAIPEYEQIDMAFVINGRNVQPIPLDFGDAPENRCEDASTRCHAYPTTLDRNGARHVVNQGIFLGNPALDYPQIDSEKDGQPTIGSDGDDNNEFDDEQGVILPKSVTPGTTAVVDVWSSIDGYLDAWIDFNSDGDWDDRGERIFFSEKVQIGKNTLEFKVPFTNNDTGPKETYSRFRLSTTGQLNYFGLAKDGEVEDHLVWINPDPTPQLDFGDTPDGDFAPGGYPTILLNNGARHKINPCVRLGRYIDGERDGQPSTGADGDDTNDLDDEDGVCFAGPLIPGNMAKVRIIASRDGFINAWIDFNADKDWDDAGEQIFTAKKIAAGVNYLEFAVGNSSAVSANKRTYARFRYTTSEENAGLGYRGLAEDGEVEDYVVTIEEPQPLFDFGDAPELRCDDPTVVRCNSYPTTLSRNGARHIIRPGIHLGDPYTDVVHIDAEPDGLPAILADGDDTTDADDEDGVDLMTPLIPGHPAKVRILVSVDGYVDAWIDFNHDGDWDDRGEQIFASQKVELGANDLEFKVPPHPDAIAVDRHTYARFRFSTYGGLKYAGAARDGEVEDYLVKIEDPDRTADLGDAPDSSNSFGVNMTAYPSQGMLPVIVPGHFPTVYRKGSPPYGPIHKVPEIVHLGAGASQEIEADYGYDQDKVNNLIPPKDIADLDGADDGVQLPLLMPPCRRTRFGYTVRVRRPVKKLFVNVWFDFNRDGDWDDVLPCILPHYVSDNTRVAREWAVRNQTLVGLEAGLHEISTPGFVSWHPRMLDGRATGLWMRITISEKPWAPAPLPTVSQSDGTILPPLVGYGGSGPKDGYWIGETEDYFFVPIIHINDLADLNGDLKVDLADVAILASQYPLEVNFP
ncbi:MAG: hypothetical protein J7M40_16230 [Planctomycetes bacterium]|nr:hypothetical protein [Planctomycetota bacterium]